MILSARKTIDEILFKESASWMELMAADGVKFEHGEKIDERYISGNVLYIFRFSPRY